MTADQARLLTLLRMSPLSVEEIIGVLNGHMMVLPTDAVRDALKRLHMCATYRDAPNPPAFVIDSANPDASVKELESWLRRRERHTRQAVDLLMVLAGVALAGALTGAAVWSVVLALT